MSCEWVVSDFVEYWGAYAPKNLVSHFYLLISRVPDIVHTFFCTLDGDMNPTFQMKTSGMFVTREINQIHLRSIFLGISRHSTPLLKMWTPGKCGSMQVCMQYITCYQIHAIWYLLVSYYQFLLQDIKCLQSDTC